MAKKSKKPAPSRRPQDKAKPAPAAAKGPNYQLGVLYGQLGNAIKAALERQSPKKK